MLVIILCRFHIPENTKQKFPKGAKKRDHRGKCLQRIKLPYEIKREETSRFKIPVRAFNGNP